MTICKTMRATLLLAFLLACTPAVAPSPNPVPAPDSTFCAAMCAHIGPGGLNCPEGQPVYDSALPGDAGVPNESCTDFCTRQQTVGVFINPRCVAEVTSCAGIEAARKQNCDTP